MCALLVPDTGEAAILDMFLSDASPEAQTLKLYKNDITPAEGDTAGTYTEATIAGYSAKSLARATWNAASTSGGITTKTYPAQTFNFSGTGTIVGYYIIKATAGTLLWSERMFTSPGLTFNASDSYTLTIQIALD